uniref:RRM domain-containing protein n=1 Tax=Caenorhabditis japonica TaxID=281687 RepID=A0A8R1HXV8_CAEJA
MSDTQIDEDVLGIDDITEDDADLSAIEGDLNEIEEEQKKLKAIQNEMVGHMNLNTSTQSNSAQSLLTPEEKAEADAKSVYVGNVDYGATAEEIEQHFHGCGSVARVTIQCDKFSGHPKGFAYVEFTDKDGMQNALAMSDSLLRGRQIKVDPKRTNKPGLSSTNRPPFRGGRGGGRGRGNVIVKYIYSGGFRPRGRGARRRPGFAPY